MTQTAPKKKLISRIFAWLCGMVVSFVAAFFVIDASGNLALSAGLYGTPGTYKVDHCYDMNPSGKNSDYVCNGTFTPHGEPDGASYEHLDHASNYGTARMSKCATGWNGVPLRPLGSGPRWARSGRRV